MRYAKLFWVYITKPTVLAAQSIFSCRTNDAGSSTIDNFALSFAYTTDYLMRVVFFINSLGGSAKLQGVIG